MGININEEYYIPMRYGEPNAPLLTWNDDKNHFEEEKPVQLIEPVSLRLADPVPAKPIMTDYLNLSDAVVSEKTKKTIEGINMHGVQLLPTKIAVGEKLYDYWYIYTYNRISDCIDFENSKCRIRAKNNKIMQIKNINLLTEKLLETPLEERLIFKLKEFPYREFFHKSVVEKIIETKPTGVAFWPLNLWHDLAYGYQGLPEGVLH